MTLVDAGDLVLMLYSYAGFRLSTLLLVKRARKAVWSKERQEQESTSTAAQEAPLMLSLEDGAGDAFEAASAATLSSAKTLTPIAREYLHPYM